MIIHIGYHKTATTFLQKNYFVQQNNFLPIFQSRKEIYDEIILPNHFEFEQERDNLKKKLESRISKIKLNNNIPFISEEELSGNPHTGGITSVIIADRLKFLFPTAKIIITIREQKNIIFSVYRQYLKEGGAKSLVSYLNPSKIGMMRSHEFSWSFYLYSNLINYYNSLFNNVLILEMENLNSDKINFIQKLNNFFEVDDLDFLEDRKANQGMTGISAVIIRLYNKMFSGGRLNTAFFIDLPHGFRVRVLKLLNLVTKPLYILNKLIDKSAKKKIEDTIQDYYAIDNEILGIYNSKNKK